MDEIMLAWTYGILAVLGYSALCLFISSRSRRSVGFPLALISIVLLHILVFWVVQDEEGGFWALIFIHLMMFILFLMMTRVNLRQKLLR